MRLIKALIAILILLIIYILISRYWKTDFDESYSCIQFVIGEDSFENVDVRFEGILNHSILKDDYISYTIWINDEKFPKDNEQLLPFIKPRMLIDGDLIKFKPVDEIQSLLWIPRDSYYTDFSYYYWVDEVKPESKYQKFFKYGGLEFDQEFENIIIRIAKEDGSSSSWSSTAGHTIIVSADSIDEAIKVVEETGGYKVD